MIRVLRHLIFKFASIWNYFRCKQNYKIAQKAVRQFASPSSENDVADIICDICKAIKNVRLENCRYLPGAIRLTYNEELDDSQQETVNDIIGIIANDPTLKSKYDGDFNGLYYEELLFSFSAMLDYLVSEERKMTTGYPLTVRDDYDVIPIPDFEAAKVFGEYVDWCITKSRFDFETYTPHGETFYFVVRKDYRKTKKSEISLGNPKDDYGLSMLAISIRKNGRLASCTTRWNEASVGNRTLGVSEICQLLNCDFHNVFVPH